MGQNPSARYFAQKVAYFEEIDKFWWFLTKCHTFCNIFLKIGSKPLCTVLCPKSCLSPRNRQVLVVFQQMPYFLQHFSKNWVKTLVQVLCTKSCLFRGDRQVLVVFHQMPYFLQHFSKNWVKTLVHSTLHEKLYIEQSSRYLLHVVRSGVY